MYDSQILDSKVIDAHEKIWKRIVDFQDELPSPYRTVLSSMAVCTPEEMEELRDKPDLQFSITDDAIKEMLNALQGLRLARPYIDDRLWDMAHSRIVFAARLLVLFSKDVPNPVEMTNWPEDKLIVHHMRNAFSQKEIEQYSFSHPRAYNDMVRTWEVRILEEIRKALFGRKSVLPTDE